MHIRPDELLYSVSNLVRVLAFRSRREPLHRNFSKQTQPHIIYEPRTEYWDQSIPSVRDAYAGWYPHGRQPYYSQYYAHNQYYSDSYYPPPQNYYQPDGMK